MLCNKAKDWRETVEMVELWAGWSRIPNGPRAIPAPHGTRGFSARGDEIFQKPSLKMRWDGKVTMF
jgi:hypothetical protein